MVMGAFADKPLNLIKPVTISTHEQEKNVCEYTFINFQQLLS